MKDESNGLRREPARSAFLPRAAQAFQKSDAMLLFILQLKAYCASRQHERGG